MISFKRKAKEFLWLSFIKLLPKINRDQLVFAVKNEGNYVLVQDEYNFVIPEPSQELAKRRFKHACGTRKVEAFYGFIVRDVRLIGPYGLPVTRRGSILLEPILLGWLPHVLWLTISELGIFGFMKQYCLAIFPFLDRPQNALDIGAHLVCRGALWPGGPVFGHWMGEQLPQIRGIEGIAEKFKLKPTLIINRAPPPWQLESLSLMGWDSRSILIHDKPGLRVKTLVFSSLRNVHSIGMECDPIARKWAAKRLRQGLRKKSAKQGSKVALFRLDSLERRIVNENEIRDAIENFGFKLLKDVTKQSLEDSAMHFLEAETLLAQYGSGITRMMFMDRPKRLIEIYSAYQDKRDPWFLFASEFDMAYYCIPAAELPDSYSKLFIDENNLMLTNSNQKVETWWVPTSEVEIVLRSL